MATFETKYITIKENTQSVRIIQKDLFDSFNEDILGLGKIDNQSKQMNALCAMFDLEGFTNFCKQIDPQLAVPEYLSEFLKWLFSAVKEEMISKKHVDGYETWADLPFLSKYLGDGVLFLWNTEKMGGVEILNVVVGMLEICKRYQKQFLPTISDKITSPPNKIRCGIARGAIYSVGNGSDFVGPCINMAARLQKLHSLTLSFARRGLNLEDLDDVYKTKFLVKKVNIRGIGSEELICILKDEYDILDTDAKSMFK